MTGGGEMTWGGNVLGGNVRGGECPWGEMSGGGNVRGGGKTGGKVLSPIFIYGISNNFPCE